MDILQTLLIASYPLVIGAGIVAHRRVTSRKVRAAYHRGKDEATAKSEERQIRAREAANEMCVSFLMLTSGGTGLYCYVAGRTLKGVPVSGVVEAAPGNPYLSELVALCRTTDTEERIFLEIACEANFRSPLVLTAVQMQILSLSNGDQHLIPGDFEILKKLLPPELRYQAAQAIAGTVVNQKALQIEAPESGEIAATVAAFKRLTLSPPRR